MNHTKWPKPITNRVIQEGLWEPGAPKSTAVRRMQIMGCENRNLAEEKIANTCGGLNEMPCKSQALDCLVPSRGNCMGRMRRVALWKEMCHCRARFPKLPSSPARSLCLLLANWDVRSLQLQLQLPATMPLLCHHNLTLRNSKSKYTLCKLSCSWYFITAIEQKLRQQRRSRVNKQGFAS